MRGAYPVKIAHHALRTTFLLIQNLLLQRLNPPLQILQPNPVVHQCKIKNNKSEEAEIKG